MLNHGTNKSLLKPAPFPHHLLHFPLFLQSKKLWLKLTSPKPRTQFINLINLAPEKEESFEEMNSVCISSCLNDTRDPRVPVRATYVNLFKWPDSDAEFVRSRRSGAIHGQPRVVGTISGRQMYLRSYRFSRKESVPEKTVKCFERVKEKVGAQGKRKSSRQKRHGRRKCLVWRKMKVALFRFYNKLLSCSASVGVVDRRNVFF